VVNASAGIGDALLLDQGARLRGLLGIDGGVNTCSASYKGGQVAGIVGSFADGEGEARAATWAFGAFKSEAKWLSQMESRGWTTDLITQALKEGEQFSAVNLVNAGNEAIRFVSPITGQSVVLDTVLNQILHIGGKGFKY
jgi:hypothetical protein